jgi:hypothetical protein
MVRTGVQNSAKREEKARIVSQYNRDMMNEDHTFSAVKSVFWDVDYRTISWDSHRDFIIQRILNTGSQDMLHWLQKTVGNQTLAAWLIEKQGAGLSPRRLRFWQLILDLPVEEVNNWVENQRRSIWQRRGA